MARTRERLAPAVPLVPAAWSALDDARASTLVEIGLALSSTLDLDALLALVVDRVAQVVSGDAATLFLRDRDTGELWSKVLHGARVQDIRLPVDRGIAGWVARTGRTVSVADAYRDDRFDSGVDRRSGYRTRSIVAAPLAGRDGRVVGVLEIIHRRAGAFGKPEERIVAAVASQAAAAVENARLFAETAERNEALAAARADLEHRVAELDLLLGIERRLGGAPDLASGIDAVLEHAIRVVGADAGAVLVLEEGSGHLWFRSARGGKADVVRKLRIARGQGIAGTVAARGRPLLANDVSRESAFDPELAGRIGYPVTSAVCVPVGDAGEVLGALELLNRRGGFGEGDQELLSAVAARIGARIAAERALERRGRDERLATIGRLLSGVMHDLRNPMTVISGFMQLMVAEKDEAERQRTCDLLLKQFDIVNAMTREVLDFARGNVEVLKRRIYVNVFMKEMEEALRSELDPAGVELRVRVSYGGAARFDEVKLRRAITNVARNAAQAMPGGGRFAVHVSRQRDRLVIRMSDTGPGIPEEIRAHLFESFATHGKEGGTGLGLAIVKRIAEEHGGGVECRTRTGKGTTFVLAIPA